MNAPTRKDLNKLRASFRGLPETAHKQMGLDAVKHAIWLFDKNDAYVAEQAAKARYHLQFAQA